MKTIDKLQQDIRMKNRSMLEKSKTIQHILMQILASILEVDFCEIANESNIDKIKLKVFTVIVIDQLVTSIVNNKWDFIVEHDTVLIYDGSKWVIVEPKEFKRFLRDVALKMGVPPLVIKHYRAMNDLYLQFLAEARIHGTIQNNKPLINLQNGTLLFNKNGFNLNEFNKEDYLTYQLPFEYDAKADCPIFKSFLNKSLPDTQLQFILAEYIASLFCRWMKMEKCLLLYGDGANGKSVFASVIYALLGSENVAAYSVPVLTNENGYARAEIEHKLLNICYELNSRQYDLSILKTLISGESIDARRPYGNAFNITSYAKLMFNSNSLPENCELTNAFFRRLLIIPWEVTIPENEQDKELSKKIIDNELPGVLNWILLGLKRLIENGNFTSSEKIQTLLKEYREISDTIRMFLDQSGIVVGDEKNCLVNELYACYRDYCMTYHLPSESLKCFSPYLQKNGFKRKRGSKGVYIWFNKTTDSQ